VSPTLFTEDTAKKMAKYPETKAVTGTELINKYWNTHDFIHLIKFDK
jgi:hypothetical protein